MPARDLRAGAVDAEQRDVEQARRDGLAVGQHVRLDQVPAAGTDEHLGDGVVQAVLAPFGGRVLEAVQHDVAQGGLTPDDVGEGRRKRVLEIDHEAVRTRVERVDHHARLGRPGDLDPAALEIRRRGRHAEVGIGRRAERRALAGVERVLAQLPRLEQRQAAVPELALQALDEVERQRGQDLVPERNGRRQGQRHAGRSSATQGLRRMPTPSTSTSTTSPSWR